MAVFNMLVRFLALSAGLLSAQHGTFAAAKETASVRTFFYVGGGYTADDGKGGHIFKDQMYVEKLEPATSRRAKRKPSPIVLIHGQGQTGTNFLSKPDGGESWTSHFLDAGYTVYIVDQTFRGRSAWAPRAGAETPSTYSTKVIEQRFTAPEKYNLWPQAKLHKQWPGTGEMGDEIFDNFYSSNVQFISNATYQQSTVQSAGAQLLEKIGTPAWVLGHSQGGLMPILIADARPNLVKGLVLLEPTGPTFQEAIFGFGASRAWGLTDIPLNYLPAVTNPAADLVKQTFQPPNLNSDNSTIPCILQAENPAPRQLPNLAPLPILTVTAEASYHAPYDYCTVEFLKQAGCDKATHMELGKIGIHGNGHMMFMEKNSKKIWKQLHKWLKKNE